MKSENMVDLMHLFSKKEQVIICGALNFTREDGQPMITRAILPFLNAEEVMKRLNTMCHTSSKGKLTYGKLVSKIRSGKNLPYDDHVKITLYLDDQKVAKRFPKNPMLGKPLTGNPVKVIAGLKWSLPDKDYVRNENVLVPRMVAMKCLKKGVWEVIMHKDAQERVIDYLMRFCM